MSVIPAAPDDDDDNDLEAELCREHWVSLLFDDDDRGE
jgi:hypothetical protein